MRRWLDQLEQFAIDVILERRYGKRAAVLRWVLHALSFVYAWIVFARLYLYRKRIFREHALGCLVISIGNLTVGGTGKTPVVEKVARALQAGGRRVAILSRGYKAKKPPVLKRIFGPPQTAPRGVSDGESGLLDSRITSDEPLMLETDLKCVTR